MKAWIDDPTILLKHSELSKLWPCSSDRIEKFNTTTRLILALTIIGYLIMNRWGILILGVIAIGTLSYIYITNDKKLEGFVDTAEPDSKIDPSLIVPTQENPLMNVMPADIIDNPERTKANNSYNREISNEINETVQDFVVKDFGDDEKVREKLYRDIGDTWEFEQSMRTWYTTPNTQIPNDQKSFTEFCFGDMKSCKDGDVISCTAPGSMPPRWTDGSNP